MEIWWPYTCLSMGTMKEMKEWIFCDFGRPTVAKNHNVRNSYTTFLDISLRIPMPICGFLGPFCEKKIDFLVKVSYFSDQFSYS